MHFSRDDKFQTRMYKLYPTVYFRPKWSKSIPYFRLKRLKNHTLWWHTYLCSLLILKEYSPPPKGYKQYYFIYYFPRMLVHHRVILECSIFYLHPPPSLRMAGIQTLSVSVLWRKKSQWFIFWKHINLKKIWDSQIWGALLKKKSKPKQKLDIPRGDMDKELNIPSGSVSIYVAGYREKM